MNTNSMRSKIREMLVDAENLVKSKNLRITTEQVKVLIMSEFIQSLALFNYEYGKPYDASSFSDMVNDLDYFKEIKVSPYTKEITGDFTQIIESVLSSHWAKRIKIISSMKDFGKVYTNRHGYTVIKGTYSDYPYKSKNSLMEFLCSSFTSIVRKHERLTGAENRTNVDHRIEGGVNTFTIWNTKCSLYMMDDGVKLVFTDDRNRCKIFDVLSLSNQLDVKVIEFGTIHIKLKDQIIDKREEQKVLAKSPLDMGKEVYAVNVLATMDTVIKDYNDKINSVRDKQVEMKKQINSLSEEIDKMNIEIKKYEGHLDILNKASEIISKKD